LNVSDRVCLQRCKENTFVFNDTCIESCPEGYTPGINNVCVLYDPEDPDNKMDLTWLWVLLGVAGGVVITCIIGIVITAFKKKKY